MPQFYTSVILLVNQSKEIGEKQFLVFVSKGGQNSPLMHIPLSNTLLFLFSNKMWVTKATGIIPFSDCGEFAASLVSGVVSFMVEGRVGFVKG